jgi:hypothetical protein
VAEVVRDDEDTGEEGQERARRRLRDERRVRLRRGGGRSCSMGVRTRMAKMGAGPGGGVEGAGGDDVGRGGGVSLRCNTAKSCLAYFHDDAALLHASLRTLAEQDIAVGHDWMEVMGAAVGRKSEAVKQGLDCLAAKDDSSAAFFRRLQSPELLVQSAPLVLRQCAVPKLNYLLRCSPHACIAEQAAQFDVWRASEDV